MKLRDIIMRETFPLVSNSGTATTTEEIIRRWEDFPLDGYTTKSISSEPRRGYKEPIVAQPNPGELNNAVGLANPGIEEFSSEFSSLELPENKALIVSLIAGTPEEFADLAKQVAEYTTADAVELNISCPHAKGDEGMKIGKNARTVAECVQAVKDAVGIDVIAKLTPNVPNIGELARAAIEAGADGITAINTVATTNAHVSNFNCGRSGKAIKERGLQCVHEISEVIKSCGRNVYLIANGGIATAEDVISYKRAGADIFGLGTVFAGMDTKTAFKYLKALKEDLRDETRNANAFVKDDLNMQYREVKILAIEKISPSLRVFTFDQSIDALPGQFVFLYDGKNEKPLSVMDNDPLMLIVRKVGDYTREMFEWNVGDKKYVRGPYGNSVKFQDKTVAVVGGCGVAPAYLLSKNHKVLTFLGLSDKKDAPLGDYLQKQMKFLLVRTDDGKPGKILEAFSEFAEPSAVVTCGPEQMMKRVVEISSKNGVPLNDIQVVVERYCKCGIGICGSCDLGGYRSCIDGPVFTADQLRDTGFGMHKRDNCGKRI